MEATGSDARKRTLALLAVLAAAFCVWLPSLRLGFVTWDDPDYVLRNPDVLHPDLARILSPSTLTVSDWTPVVTLVHAATHAAGGGAASAFHLVNVAAHLAAAYLVARLLAVAGFPSAESLIAAALFAVHPLQVESVTWISSLKNCLVACFGLGFVRAHLAGRPVAATALLVLALGSKGTAIAFPVIALAATLLGIGKPTRSPATWTWFAGWAVLAAGRAAISIGAQTSAVAGTSSLGFAGRMAVMGGVLLAQLRQVLAPFDLSILYDWPRMSWAEPRVLLAWAAVAGLVAVVVRAARRDRAVAFAAVLAAASLAPTMNIVPAPYVQADRYVHVALAGVAALLAAALRPLARLRPWLPAALVLAWMAAVVVPQAIARQSVWRSGEALYDDACRKAPESGVAWGNLGAELLALGRTADAKLALEKALATHHPEPHVVLTNLAWLAHDEGDLARADELAVRALAASADSPRALALRGRVASATGRFDEARRLLDHALRIDPAAPPSWVFRAELGVRTGRLAEAREDVARAEALPQGRAAIASVAAAVEFLEGHPDAALARLRATAPAGMTDADLRAVLAQKLAYLGRPDAAERAFRGPR